MQEKSAWALYAKLCHSSIKKTVFNSTVRLISELFFAGAVYKRFLIVKHNIQQRAVDFKFAVVMNQSFFSEAAQQHVYA